MAQNNLPEVIGTVGELMSFDNGNVFRRNFLFPRKAEKRLEAQKEVLIKMIDAKKEARLAEIEARLVEIEAKKQIILEQLKYSYDIKELQHETVRQYFQCLQDINGCDLDKVNDFLSSGFENFVDIISKL